jgi:hypothetical protein
VRSYLDYEQVPILIIVPMLRRFPPADHLVDGVVDEGLQTVPSDGDLACGILIILELAKLVGGSGPEFEGLCACLKILLLLV